LANANITNQATHIAGTKNIAYQAIGFVHRERIAIHGRNTSRILTAVL
jgi:hypothetical protein